MSNIFYKKLPGVEYNLIHLYEHLIVRGWLDFMVDNGQNPLMVEYVEGQTFYEMTFFYVKNDKLAKQAQRYLQQPHIFRRQDVDNELAAMGAEKATLYSISNYDELRKMLLKIDGLAYNSLDSIEAGESRRLTRIPRGSISPNALIVPLSGHEQYDIVSINIDLSNPDIPQSAAFYMFDYLIKNAAHQLMCRQYGAYPASDVTDDSDYDGSLTTTCDYYVKRGSYDVDIIRMQLENRLRSFDPRQYSDKLDEINAEPIRASLPLDCFNEIGLLLSIEKFHQYCTARNVADMWSRLKIGGINVFPDRRGCRDIYLGRQRWNR